MDVSERYDQAMVMVEEAYMPLTLSAPHLMDEEFQELCDKYSDYRLEYSAAGELFIMPPTDPETGARNAAITHRLRSWALTATRGVVTDSSSGFMLPDRSRLWPDSAWISRARLLARPTCPEFVIELMSPTDRRKRSTKRCSNGSRTERS